MEFTRHFMVLLVLIGCCIFSMLADTECNKDEDVDRTPRVIQRCVCTRSARDRGCTSLRVPHTVMYGKDTAIDQVSMGCNCDKKPQSLIHIIPGIDGAEVLSTNQVEVSTRAEDVVCTIDSDEGREDFKRCECTEAARAKGCTTTKSYEILKYKDGMKFLKPIESGCNCIKASKKLLDTAPHIEK